MDEQAAVRIYANLKKATEEIISAIVKNESFKNITSDMIALYDYAKSEYDGNLHDMLSALERKSAEK